MSDRFGMLSSIASLIACLMLSGPATALTQPTANAFRIGFLTGSPLSESTRSRNAFRDGLSELGYVEGKNIVIEWRSDEGKPGRGRAQAAELVRDRVNVIVAVGSGDIRRARKATASIPIVMVVGGDAVRSGFVASLARPGGNITGLATLRPELAAKRLEILKETMPGISRVAVFSTSIMSDYAEIQQALGRRANALGVTLRYLDVLSPSKIDTAFRGAVKGQAEAILFEVAKPLFVSRLPQIAELAAKSRLPLVYERPDIVEAGGLLSYGVDRIGLFRRAADYVGKILKGANPADLPVEQPTKFQLVVNLKTAKALGIRIPSSILLRADQVIE